jgi:hypothetical protein
MNRSTSRGRQERGGAGAIRTGKTSAPRSGIHGGRCASGSVVEKPLRTTMSGTDDDQERSGLHALRLKLSGSTGPAPGRGMMTGPATRCERSGVQRVRSCACGPSTS